MKVVLETDRIYLREFTHDDADYIYKLHNDKDVNKYISPNQEEFTKEQSKKLITWCIDAYKKNPGFGIWAAVTKDTNKFIGWATLKDLDGTEDIEVGYRYFKEFWGKGYATEIASKLVEYGFNKMKLKTIVAIAVPENKASIRVIEKSGMKYEGIKHYYDTDVAFYRIMKDKKQ